jgi:hypothetical protein
MKIIFAIGPKTDTKKLKKLSEDQGSYENSYQDFTIYYLIGLKKEDLVNKILSLKPKIINEQLEKICVLLNQKKKLKKVICF